MKLRNIITILATASLLTACDDVFSPAAENFKDIDQMEQEPDFAKGFMVTAYRNLPVYVDGSDIVTDDAVTNNKSDSWMKNATGSYTAQSWDPSSRWNSDLSSVQYLNIFLQTNLDNIEFLKNQFTNALMRRRLKGEAYGLRAIHQYYLLRAHAGFDAEGNLLGTLLYRNVVDSQDDHNQARLSFKENVDSILVDLDRAEALLPLNYGDAATVDDVPTKYDDILKREEIDTVKDLKKDLYNVVMGGKVANNLVSGLIVRAFRARTLLLAASPAFQDASNPVTWAQAADAAASVVDVIGGPAGLPAKGLTYYTNDDEIAAIANGSNPPEIIWRKDKDTKEIDDEKNNYPPSLYGSGRTNPTQNLVDAFPTATGYPITDSRSGYDANDPYANRDPRLSMYIIYNGAKEGPNDKTIYTGSNSGTDDGIGVKETSTRTGYYMKKMLNMTANCNSTSQNVVTKYSARARYTEFFLDYAEAANEAWGPKADNGHGYSAYDVIKAIRNRAGITDETYLDECATSKEKMRELIRNERRLELCFEGFRFWDLRRWNANMNTQVDGVNWNGNTPVKLENIEERKFEDYMHYGPIPYSEVLKYTNLKQNKGW